MSDFHVGQTNLKIELDTGVDVTSGTLKIKYKKPNGDEGNFPATIDAVDNNKIYYNILTASDLDRKGDWIFWAHVIFSDSTIGIGSAKKQKIKSEGAI